MIAIDLQALVESHEDPFVVIDADYRIVAVNRAYEQAYGVDRGELLHRTCYEASHLEERPCHEAGEVCPYRRVFHGEGPQTCLHTHHDAQGRRHWVRVSVHTLRGADGSVYLGERMQELSVEDTTPNAEPRLVGHSRSFLNAVEQLSLAAQTDLPVLLQGETGTGKELAASFIHRHSHRSGRAFMTLDCTVLNENLFEAEVFGHARGAFTGSVGEKPGLYELANGGTLFLDEVGEMPLNLQAKFLRVIESGQFRPVGGRDTKEANVRLVCATNRNLWEAVEHGQFREDLYYRVACLTVHMPSLRERIDDLPDLAQAMLARICKATRSTFELTAEALEALEQHDYPGNVRELRNILQAAAAECRGRQIGAEQIRRALEVKPRARPPSPRARRAAIEDRRVEDNPAPPPSLDELEIDHIVRTLERCAGNRRKAAAALGISERTLYRRLRRLGLSRA